MNRPRPSLRTTHLVAALLVAALALSLCAPAGARGTKRRPRPRSAVATQPAPVPAGAVIAIDPETGRLGMPTAAQMLELSAAERTGLLRTADGLVPVRLPDGSIMVDLQGRFQTFTILRLDALGRPQLLPAEDMPALQRALAAPAPAPAAEER